jgi:hypothetical protein
MGNDSVRSFIAIVGVLIGFSASLQGAGSHSIIAVRLMDRKALCFTGKTVAATCKDWESGHAYNVGDQIFPKSGNADGLTYEAQSAGKADTIEPTWPQFAGHTVQDGSVDAGVLWVAQDTITRHYIRVDFSDAHPNNSADLRTSNVRVTTGSSNKPLQLTTDGMFNAGFGQNQTATFELSDEAITAPGDMTVRICFTTYAFTDKTVTNLCGDGKIYNDSNIGDLVNDSKKALNSSVATSKTSAEKDIFAGLSISVPSGGGETQGSGDLNLNHYFTLPLLGQGVLGLEIKKGSSINADPHHFTGGMKARKTWLLGVNKDDLSKLISGIESNPGDDATVLMIDKIQRHYFRSIYFDNGISYEGDLSNGSVGNVSNVVYDGELWVNTAVRSLTRTSGFVNLRIIPLGVEAGYNVSANAASSPSSTSTLSNSSTPPNDYSLARVKSGGTFTLSSQSPYLSANSPRLDLEVTAIDRYLFEKELLYNAKTSSYSSTGTGSRYWAQVAVKVLAGSVGTGSVSGRPGLKLAFERGSLPPVYAFTKVFTVSLIYETNDNASEEINIVNKK